MHTVPLWSDLRASLPDGLSTEAYDLVRRATAPARHSARVAVTAHAAIVSLGYELASWALTAADLDAARLLIVLDQHGAGGRDGAGGPGCGTRRMSWAACLGTGRRNAMDGGAWMAAADDAAGLLYRAADDARHIAPRAAWLALPAPVSYAMTIRDDEHRPTGHWPTPDAVGALAARLSPSDRDFAAAYCRWQIRSAVDMWRQPERDRLLIAWDAVLRDITSSYEAAA